MSRPREVRGPAVFPSPAARVHTFHTIRIVQLYSQSNFATSMARGGKFMGRAPQCPERIGPAHRYRPHARASTSTSGQTPHRCVSPHPGLRLVHCCRSCAPHALPWRLAVHCAHSCGSSARRERWGCAHEECRGAPSCIYRRGGPTPSRGGAPRADSQGARAERL